MTALKNRLTEHETTIAQIIQDLQDSFDLCDIELVYSLSKNTITIVCKCEPCVDDIEELAKGFILDCYELYHPSVKKVVKVAFERRRVK